jgi:cysteinyl-tRNA synthetase
MQRPSAEAHNQSMDEKITFYNTLGRREKKFEPVELGRVRLYTCGPTVYNYAHIGNLRTYILWDVLRRMLAYFGYEVRHAMNVTDVGHLISDADSGEDRMLLGARREGKSVWEIARFYEKVFFNDLAALNIWPPGFICRATEHIPEMIALVQDILDKGYGYEAGGNVYFSVDRFPNYGELAGQVLDQQLAEARVDPDENKRNPFDFVLWFTESKYPDQVMKWDSPWGVGFPGWHVECSAMAIKYLGEHVDIHCGGVDHIPVHHTNEIAQSEAVLGHQWVNYWLHSEFLMMKKDRMSKSSGQFITLAEIQRRGFLPLEYRYFCLGAHYRSKITFDWTALEGARNALDTLRNRYLDWLEEPAEGESELALAYAREFDSVIARDLDTPQALAVLWKMVKDPQLGNSSKRDLLLEFDRVLGIGVSNWERDRLPADLRQLIEQREEARERKDFAAADSLREQLLAAGVVVKDTSRGPQWYYSRRQPADR